MQPREARGLLGRNHAELRAMLDRLETLIDRVVAEDVGASQQFFAHCDGLCGALLRHIDLEDSVLVPLLRAHHPQGEVEAADLLRHHEAQRRWLKDVLGQRGAPPSSDMLRAVRALAHILRVDMDHEELELDRLG